MASTQTTFVLPGDAIAASQLPSHPKHPLKLGPGLRHIPPNEITPSAAGRLQSDRKKNTIWVERTTGRYIPSTGDRVIGTVLRSQADAYLVQLAPYAAPAALPHLAFESATRKTRPVLPAGALVYARVASSAAQNKHMDPELECISAETGRADGLGPLGFTGAGGGIGGTGGGGGGGGGVRSTTGMMFGVSLGMARRLLMPRSAEDGGLAVLDELEAVGLAFETVVGRNGRVWVDGGGDEREKEKDPASVARTVVVVGRAICETDERGLGPEEQKKLVRSLVGKATG